MKRTDITDLFPDATKEQVDKLMGINGSDINAAKGEVDSLRNQLNALQQSSGDSDELATATASIAALRAELDGMKQAETLRQTREKVAKEKSVPASLLTGETEDDCNAQAQAILDFAKSSGYPVVRDGGESGGAPKSATRDSFEAWAKDQL